jgi:uncharacterized protein YjbI with pentapeptide repeats
VGLRLGGSVRLSDDAFDAVETALLDAFANAGEFKLIARCLGTRLQDITSESNRLPIVVLELIEWVESRDQVTNLIKCAKKQNSENERLAGLDFATLEAAPTTAELVDAGGGKTKFKEHLKNALEELNSPGLELVAASELSKLLAAGTDEEADTLYLALVGNVKANRADEVVNALAPIVAKYLRRRIENGRRPVDVSLDLARARLGGIDLSGLDLHEADVAFADLSHARLDKTNLWRSRGYAVNVTGAGLSRSNLEEARWHAALARKARFHNCRMVSVFLKEADLTGSEFQQSRLQGAHFERADLTGARFEEADLADAFFLEATIDQAAAASISRAHNWKKAWFDPKARKLIEQKGGA